LSSFRLAALFNATDASNTEAAWAEFVKEHSRLLIHVARDLFKQHDGAMDAYAFVLERLKEDSFRRLRAFQDDGRSRFTTWLTVVARRLCLDYYRHRYGRPRGDPKTNGAAERLAARRRLLDLTVAQNGSIAELAAGDSASAPDAQVRAKQLSAAVGAAVATLSSEEQLLLKLRFDDGLSGSEIARVLGFATPFHVFRRLNATYDRLRGALHARGVENSAP
jgi:RNA polymerase sigma factor (sigma-70 family)